MKSLRVVVSGAAGLIGYSLSGLLGDGTVFGTDYLVELVLHDIPRCEQKLIALKEELLDCAFEYVSSIEFFTDPRKAFTNADVVFFLASLPLTGGDRRSMLCKNVDIYIDFGKALDECAHKNCISIVVANPANTLTYVLMMNAPSLSRKNFVALNTTDHNRARSIALRICREKYDPTLQLTDIHGIISWGNHGNSMYADTSRATVRGELLRTVVPDDSLWEEDFVSQVERRGWVLLQLRGGVSSVLSVARASVVLARWLFNGSNGEIVTLAACSDENPYGIQEGLIFGMPVICENGSWRYVENIPMNENLRKRIEISTKDLQEEVEIANSQMEIVKNHFSVCFDSTQIGLAFPRKVDLEENILQGENTHKKRGIEELPFESVKKAKIPALAPTHPQDQTHTSIGERKQFDQGTLPIESGVVTDGNDFGLGENDLLSLEKAMAKVDEVKIEKPLISQSDVVEDPIETETPVLDLLPLEPLSDSDFDVI